MTGIAIAVASDLHLEFDRAIRARGCGSKPTRARKTAEAERHPKIGPNLAGLSDRCEVLVLAGDVDLGVHAIDYAAAVSAWLAVPVVLIAGNHEFYHAPYDETLLALREKAAAMPGVHFLENDRVDLVVRDRRVRFLGCTLWTDFALFGPDRRSTAMTWAGHAMTDFRGTITKQGSQRFEPGDALALHERSLAWLEAALAEEFDGATVVVTHHGPTFRSVPPQYRKDLLSAAYASNLDALV